jgi:hypothetical protein
MKTACSSRATGSKDRTSTDILTYNSKERTNTDLPTYGFKERTNTDLPTNGFKERTNTDLPTYGFKERTNTDLPTNNSKECTCRQIRRRNSTDDVFMVYKYFIANSSITIKKKKVGARSSVVVEFFNLPNHSRRNRLWGSLSL